MVLQMVALREFFIAEVTVEPFVTSMDRHMAAQSCHLQRDKRSGKGYDAPGMCTAAPRCAFSRGFATDVSR